MGYETEAFILKTSKTSSKSEFVKYNNKWLHAWRDLNDDGSTKTLYHYNETMVKETVCEMIKPEYLKQPCEE